MTVFSPVFSSGATPSEAANDDAGSITVGVEFVVAAPAWLVGWRWYQPSTGPVKIAARTGGLWGAGGVLVASSSPVAPVGSGWQTIPASSPIPLATGVNYVAGVHHPSEGYAATGAWWTTGPGASGLVAGPVSMPSASGSVAGQNLFTAAGAGAGMSLPTSTFGGGQYWLDVVVDDVEPSPVRGSITLRLG